MQLFFRPLACSMATRIALYEAGRPADYVEADHAPQSTPHPLGLVPALRLDDGSLLTENSAILQYVADDTSLIPRDRRGRAELQQWLSFIGTELHKLVFHPLLDRTAPDGAKRYALGKAASRLEVVDRHLAGRDYMLAAFSIVDAYLFTVLNWAPAAGVDVAKWPAITAYLTRLRARPALARAVAEEFELFRRAHAGEVRPATTRATIDRFNDAFLRHAPDAIAPLVADDCTIENTHPAPDGERRTGKAACVELWRGIAGDPEVAFELESVDAIDDRATIFWRLRRAGSEIRGVNLMRVRDGLIVEARGYVKGA
jgi:glutathione S-transferase